MEALGNKTSEIYQILKNTKKIKFILEKYTYADFDLLFKDVSTYEHFEEILFGLFERFVDDIVYNPERIFSDEMDKYSDEYKKSLDILENEYISIRDNIKKNF
jgi:hypothetical protein